jgi:phage gpG-like protein
MLSQRVNEFVPDIKRLTPALESKVPEMMAELEPTVLEGVFENFVRESSPDGIAWPPRKERGDGHPLLVEIATEGSGSLLAAATSREAQGHIGRVEGNALLVGVDKQGGIGGIPGAAVHNYGFVERNIPQREYLGLTEDYIDLCMNIVADEMVDRINYRS